MYKTRNKPHRGIFSLASLSISFTQSLSLSFFPLDETKPRDTFARVCIQFHAPIELLRRFDSQRRIEPILLRETGFDNLSDDIRFARLVASGCRGSPPGKHGVHLARKLERVQFSAIFLRLSLTHPWMVSTKRDNAFLCTRTDEESSNLSSSSISRIAR